MTVVTLVKDMAVGTVEAVVTVATVVTVVTTTKNHKINVSPKKSKKIKESFLEQDYIFTKNFFKNLNYDKTKTKIVTNIYLKKKMG